jgi:hypothetical protein
MAQHGEGIPPFGVEFAVAIHAGAAGEVYRASNQETSVTPAAFITSAYALRRIYSLLGITLVSASLPP